jgi:hypothetical protein
MANLVAAVKFHYTMCDNDCVCVVMDLLTLESQGCSVGANREVS